MEGHSAVPHPDGACIVFGGRGADDSYSAALWELQVRRGADGAHVGHWRSVVAPQRTASPAPRAYHAAALLRRSSMVVTYGVSDRPADIAAEAVWVLPLRSPQEGLWERRTTSGDVPARRCCHSLCVSGDSVYLHGGYPVGDDPGLTLDSDLPPSAHADFYSLYELSAAGPQWTWRRVRADWSLRLMLWGHTATTYARNVVMFGGQNAMTRDKSNTVCVFSAAKGEWKCVEALPPPRVMHAAATSGTVLLVHGGARDEDDDGGAKLSDLWQLNLATGKWTEMAPAGDRPPALSGHAMSLQRVPKDSGAQLDLLVLGGTDAAGRRLQDRVTPCPAWVLEAGRWYRLLAPAPPSPSAHAATEVAMLTPPVSTPPASAAAATDVRGVMPTPLAPLSHAPHSEDRSSSPARSPSRGVVPYADDRPASPGLIFGRHAQLRSSPGQPQRQPVRHTAQERTPAPPAAHVATQAVQTAATGDTTERLRAEADAVIQRQWQQIDELRSMLAESTKAAPAPNRDPFVSVLEYSVTEPAPKLSASTQHGPEISLTTATLADLLPLVRKSPSTGRYVDPAARARLVAAPIAAEKAAAAAAASSGGTATALEHRWVRQPALLPTASVDPTAPPPLWQAPGSLHTGVGPVALAPQRAAATAHYPSSAAAPAPQSWAELVAKGPAPEGAGVPAPPSRHPADKRHRPPTLSQIISGRASMLSISHTPQLPRMTRPADADAYEGTLSP
eukprot:TRINITY_DN30320_c0_g1_i1.p1 TRINITY_DN30320_c0_g1~~TRINITY_DN30320_c0_g1_i1.p1  ORF type:complete len:746 (+),score=245.16 TRINITY_DN30320_c0_g1_i1:47-2239(+)